MHGLHWLLDEALLVSWHLSLVLWSWHGHWLGAVLGLHLLRSVSHGRVLAGARWLATGAVPVHGDGEEDESDDEEDPVSE
jgi:hypothetical protein